MLKNILILFNLLGLFLMNLFFPQEVTVNQDLPSNIPPGESAEVTVQIQKGSVSGFAKLELYVPEGLSATSIDSKGASFTFEEQEAKFIWMSLPSEEDFEVKYKLIADEDMSGAVKIGGKFSFIKENERRSVTIGEKDLAVAEDGEEVAIRSDGETETQEEGSNEKEDQGGGDSGDDEKLAETKESDDEEAEGSSSTTETTDGSRAEVKQIDAGSDMASRKITKISDQEYKVQLTLYKGEISGFAKVMEEVPDAFRAESEKTGAAVFSFQEGVAKFVWMNIPKKQQIEVSYYLIWKGLDHGSFDITGSFSYLEANNTKAVDIGTTSINIPEEAEKEEDVAVKSDEPEETPEKTDVGDEEGEEVAQADGTKEDQQDAQEEEEKEQDDGKVSKAPAPEKGLDYKVQICAGHQDVKQNHFARVYDFNKEYSIDQHEGWLKYLHGKFSVYKDARDKREQFRNNYDLPGPFVTAYNKGERITVQEALMITNQKWVP